MNPLPNAVAGDVSRLQLSGKLPACDAELQRIEVVTAVRLGSGAGAFEIPTDGLGQVIVPYVGDSSLLNDRYFPYISATDVLQDNLTDSEREALTNSLVLVGTSAPGLGDIRAMPLQQVYPGVEVHANMLNALLNSVSVVDAPDKLTRSLFSLHFPEMTRSIFLTSRTGRLVGFLS